MLSDIRSKIKEKKINWRVHATQRLIERGISRASIIHSILNCEIIEEYPADFPFPSCLILGFDENSSPLHSVCAIGQNYLWIITVYKPASDKWENNYKTRRR